LFKTDGSNTNKQMWYLTGLQLTFVSKYVITPGNVDVYCTW